MSLLRRVGIMAAVVILSTLALPWWSVAVVGLLYGFLIESAKAWQAGLAGVLGWGILLAVAAVQGPVGVLAGRLGGLFHAPGTALFVVTVLFAGALGGAGTGVGRAISPKPEAIS